MDSGSVDSAGVPVEIVADASLVAPPQCLPDEPMDPRDFDDDYVLLTSGDPVQDANLYLLTLFAEVPAASEALGGDAVLLAVSQERDLAFRGAIADCGGDAACLGDALRWSEDEAGAVADALQALFIGPDADILLVKEHLRPSGVFHLYRPFDDGALVRAAWLDAVDVLNRIFAEHDGLLPAEDLAEIAAAAVEDDPMPFYLPLLKMDMAILTALGRDEAGRYEPLADGENGPACQRIPLIEWDDYPYSLILTPGFGPLNGQDPISMLSLTNCAFAAERYYAGLAPLVMFSGGHVHPGGTPFCEALEMKHVLMEEHGVPEEAILIEPYARHTTTNLRNAARLILRYGIPPDRPVLIATDIFQNHTISYSLAERCLEELGYVPFRKVELLNDNDSCLLIDSLSLHRDGQDLLDP